ncbi:3775_t:CDS:2 [Ambispora leptoticha]|uniref:3775_t:CDS:1 n=1 Tax=Ambispora leptoticha TaxID=144679 RepID=A0A9N9ABK4_9GLOM|nr:3775_t:CDS:2 [Ambispora leptoticha]
MPLKESKRVQAKSKAQTREGLCPDSIDDDMTRIPVAKKSKTRDSYHGYAQLRKRNTKDKQVQVVEAGDSNEEEDISGENKRGSKKRKKSGNKKKGDSSTCQLMYDARCLSRRYAENYEEASSNKEWKCPKCRGKCNCSVCRRRQGLLPIGVFDFSRDSHQVETLLMNDSIYNNLMLTIVIEDNNIDSMLSHQEKITNDLETSDSIDTFDITSQFLYPIVYVNNNIDSYIDLGATTNNYDTSFGPDFYQSINPFENSNHASGLTFPFGNTLTDYYPMSNSHYYKPIDDPYVAIDHNPTRVIAENTFPYNPIFDSEYSYTNNIQIDKHIEDNFIPLITFNNNTRFIYPIFKSEITMIEDPVQLVKLDDICKNPFREETGTEGEGKVKSKREEDDGIDWSKFPDGVCVYIPARS